MATLSDLTSRLRAMGDEELASIEQADTTATLEEARRKIFGRKGRLSAIMGEMGRLAEKDRPALGKAANKVKAALQEALDARARRLKEGEILRTVEKEAIDVTLPGIPPSVGTLHPITRTMREIEEIFVSMGFSIELGPDIEDDYHNFEALNIPADHPARDMQDTFYLDAEMMLRTHTSPVQIRTMKSKKPPLAVIAPGKVYRCDADSTHSPVFHQVEGFMVDTNISFSDLKGVLESYIHRMFGPQVPFRLRPSYFPFTEPSAEVDIFFERRHPDGHMVRDWMEILGAGMIHPKVFENCGIDPEQYTGFAFGTGVERPAMIKYGINSIAMFYENDVRFLRQFR